MPRSLPCNCRSACHALPRPGQPPVGLTHDTPCQRRSARLLPSLIFQRLPVLWLAALLLGSLPALAAPLTHLTGASGSLFSPIDNQFYFNVNYNPNGKSAATSFIQEGVSISASASLPAGELKLRSTGNVGPLYGNVNVAAAAYLLDTITATGSLGGSNLGVSINIHGTTLSSDYQNNANFLLIGFYEKGHFQAASSGTRDFYDPAYRLFGRAYAFGNQANQVPNLSGYNYTVSGWFPDGHNAVPLSIPFALLGSGFEIHLLLGSQQSGSSITLSTWDNNFANTVGISLSADPGVSLFSASGSLPGTASEIPEPQTWAMLLPAPGLLLWSQQRRFLLRP